MQRLTSRLRRPAGWRVAAAVGAAMVAGLFVAARAHAQTGTLAGTVTDRSTNAPVPAAQVQIVGTTRGALSGDDGKFRIPAVSAGPIQLRVTRIGYDPCASAAGDAACWRCISDSLQPGQCAQGA